MAATPQPSRYIPFPDVQPLEMDLRSVRNLIFDALDANVRRVHRHPSARSSAYIGSAGTILMDWKVATVPDLSFKAPSALAFSMSFSRPSDGSGSRTAFLETSVGPATLILIQELRNVSTGVGKVSTKTWEPCTQLLSDAISIALSEGIDDDGCEVLYGRAGLLYALLRLRCEMHSLSFSKEQLSRPVIVAIGQICSEANIKALADDIVMRGRFGAEMYARHLHNEEQHPPPLMWSWHGKRYLGAAHGVAGILQMLICVPESLIAEHWGLILETVRWLLDIQLPFGNWPSKASRHMHAKVEEDPEQEQLVQWCHGATGVIILFSNLILRYTHPHNTLKIPPPLLCDIRSSLIRGADLIYRHGLLRKGVGLCHGVAGQVYTLLSVSDALNHLSNREESSTNVDSGSVMGVGVPSPNSDQTDSTSNHTHSTPNPSDKIRTGSNHLIPLYFLRAIHLAQLTTTYETLTHKGEMRTPDRPYSLYEGIAGMCCAWAEVLRRLDGVLGGVRYRRQGNLGGGRRLSSSAGTSTGNGRGSRSVSVGRGGGKWEELGVGVGMPGYDDLGVS